MRRAPFVALLMGVVLLSAGLLAMAAAVAQERQQGKTLKRDAAQVGLAFSSYFERARSLNLLLAQNPAFSPPSGQLIDNAEANRALARPGWRSRCVAGRVRCVAGRSRAEALSTTASLLERGHGVSIDLFGELVRDPATADRVVEDYQSLAAALPPPP